MDLNHLYFQHQIALMKASLAASSIVRLQLLECADSIAQKIGNYQQAQGAAAGVSWLDASQSLPRTLGKGAAA